jgi:hypothetical protein
MTTRLAVVVAICFSLPCLAVTTVQRQTIAVPLQAASDPLLSVLEGFVAHITCTNVDEVSYTLAFSLPTLPATCDIEPDRRHSSNHAHRH